MALKKRESTINSPRTPLLSTARGRRGRSSGGGGAGRRNRGRQLLQIDLEGGDLAVVAEAVVERLHVPTIGIGAGPATAGQVLVFHDLLGIREGRGGKFVQRYADLQDEMNAGVAAYAADVRDKAYPQPDHEYAMEPAEVDALRAALAELPPA